MKADAQTHEQERLASLDRYDILDTPPEEAFDRIARLTRLLFDVPMSTITLVDDNRQWFKSRQGVAAPETPKGPALCNVVVREGRALVVPNTMDDMRFSSNPFVLGEPHIRFYAGVPLHTPERHCIGTLCAMDTKPRTFPAEQMAALADLAHIVMTELELRRLATTDGLTGALSRRAFRDECARGLALALRHHHELSCLMFDIDHFKSVNDRYGHPIGDQVLSATVAACRKELRMSDPLGRMGGEEFAVLLPHTGSVSAMNVAEKLRAAIARSRIATPQGSIGVTASFGVATLDASAGNVGTLLRRADAALYEAKGNGRNRCNLWRSDHATQATFRAPGGHAGISSRLQ